MIINTARFEQSQLSNIYIIVQACSKVLKQYIGQLNGSVLVLKK